MILFYCSNGSVKIDFKVLYREPSDSKEKNRKAVVANILQQETLNGSLGGLELSGNIQIQGKSLLKMITSIKNDRMCTEL